MAPAASPRSARHATDAGRLHTQSGRLGHEWRVILSINRVYSADGKDSFAIERVPQVGEALMLDAFMGQDKLVHIAANEADARTWLQTHGYPQARIEIVGDADPMAAAA